MNTPALVTPVLKTKRIRFAGYALVVLVMLAKSSHAESPQQEHVGIVNGTVVTAGAFPTLTALLSGREVSITLNQQQQINGRFFGHGQNTAFEGQTAECGQALEVCQDVSEKICVISLSSLSTKTPAEQLANCSAGNGTGAVFLLGDSVPDRTDMFDGFPSIPAVFISDLQSNRLLIDAMRSGSLHVSVQRQISETILCGATHLGGRWVLTAAHCVVEQTTEGIRKIHPWEITASVGAFDLTEDTHLSQSVQSIYLFDEPETVNAIRNDIALLKLTRQPTYFRDNSLFVELDSTPVIEITAAAAVEEYSLSAADAMVLGWGSVGVREPDEMVSPTDSTSSVPHAAWVSLVPDNQCIDLWRDYLTAVESPTTVTPINSRQMCAIEPVSQRDTCQGDSGGPLLIVVEGRLQLAGITSFGVGCGSTTGVPAVYTKVSEFTDWIASVTGIKLSDSSDQPEASGSSISPPVRVSAITAVSGGGSVTGLLLFFTFISSVARQRMSLQSASGYREAA